MYTSYLYFYLKIDTSDQKFLLYNHIELLLEFQHKFPHFHSGLYNSVCSMICPHFGTFSPLYFGTMIPYILWDRYRLDARLWCVCDCILRRSHILVGRILLKNEK